MKVVVLNHMSLDGVMPRTAELIASAGGVADQIGASVAKSIAGMDCGKRRLSVVAPPGYVL
jgi:hypothetical protein